MKKIKSHKGGRTERVHGFRLTKEEKGKLEKILKETSMSLSDWIVEQLTKKTP